MFPQSVRNFRAAALLSAGAILAAALLTGCTSPSNTAGSAPAPSPVPTTTATTATAATPSTPARTSPSQRTATAGKTQRSGGSAPPGPRTGGASCTNLYDYAGDSRSNAEINSIGESTGTCPPIRH